MIKNAKVKDNQDGTVTVSGNCFVTKKPHSVTVPKLGFVLWQNGEHIQDAFLNVSADDREFLISGTSPEGWKKLFGKEEE